MSSGVLKKPLPALLAAVPVSASVAPEIDAVPLCVHEDATGAGTVPVPLNCTWCSPVVSSPLICHVPLL